MKRVAVLMLIAAAAVNAASAQQMTLRVGVELVNVLFTVTDRKGSLVPGLTQRDFVVEEDGQKQDIRFFSREQELPLTIALLVDTSPSVRPVFDDERRAANRFFASILRPKDLALVIGFDKTVTMFQDYTEDVRTLQRAIDELELGPTMNGGTSMYDAVYLAAKEKLDGEAGRKAIILITDGQDTTSKVRSDTAMLAVHQSDTVIYSIAIAGRWRAFRRTGDSGALKRLSEETGGSFFHIYDRKDFDEAFSQINEELRNQYSLGYVSSNEARDGKYRRIKITPRDPNYRVQSRKGYYAATSTDPH